EERSNSDILAPSDQQRSSTRGCRTMSAQRKLKHRALRNIRGHPQLAFMGLDDRATNRQAHPHPAGFRREQWIEYSFDILRADSCPAIGDRNHHAVDLVCRLLLEKKYTETRSSH